MAGSVNVICEDLLVSAEGLFSMELVSLLVI